MHEHLVKYSLGIDMAKDRMDVCLISLIPAYQSKHNANLNSPGGFKELEAWFKKHCKEAVALPSCWKRPCITRSWPCTCFWQEPSVSVVHQSQALHAIAGQNSKNDRADAKGAWLVWVPAQRFTPWQPLDTSTINCASSPSLPVATRS